MAKAKEKKEKPAAGVLAAERDERTVTTAPKGSTKGAIDVHGVTAFSVAGNGNILKSVALDGDKRIENVVKKESGQKFSVKVDID